MSHPDKDPQSKQPTRDRERYTMKKANHLVYMRFCFRPAQKYITLVRTSFLHFSNIRPSQKPVQRRLQNFKNKGSHQWNQEWHSRLTQNVRRHEMYSTWFSNDVMRFRPCRGGVKLPFLVLLPYHDQLIVKTQLRSALGLRSTNVKRINNYSSKSRWIVAEYLVSREAAR